MSYRVVAAKIAGISAALAERDQSTQEHCDRVANLCLELGQACALSEREVARLALCAGLHDIGKIGIPDEVLKKTTTFEERDREIMRTHCERGERIVLAADLEDATEVAAVVRHHHERFDGDGYPDGLAGEDIPVLARIVAVVDAYDAMARLRAYGVPRTHHDIMRELLREDGSQHDPFVLTKFSQVIGRSQFRVPD